uniref:Death domain-containing protein n=1 Tax=Parascaris equorum TaxID=6256 RepID=A0A914S675_PAREQ
MSDGLKYYRGEMLSNDHWLELFRLLGVPKGTTLERLHFEEVTIREAIQELELWAAQAEFTLTEYKHTNDSVIKVIKDWRDSYYNSVGFNFCYVM